MRSKALKMFKEWMDEQREKDVLLMQGKLVYKLEKSKSQE